MKLFYQNWSSKIFEGFYESPLFNSDMLFDFESELPEDYEWDIDFKGYKTEVCQKWTNFLICELSNNENIRIEYKGLYSPASYNYTTDKIILSVDVDLRWLNSFCFKKNKQAFNGYLQKNWTDKDDFYSFIPNSLIKFKNEYKNCSNYRKNQLIQIMFEFYLLNKVDFNSINMDLYESIYEILDKYKFITDKNGNKYTEFYWNNENSVYEIA